MSVSEQDTPQVEQRSSVKISTTAKMDALVEVKAYTNDLDQLDAARVAAVAAYKQTLADLGVRVVGPAAGSSVIGSAAAGASGIS